MVLGFSGGDAYLYELRQFLTYEGLLEGLPTMEGNQRHILALLNDKRNHAYGDAPYLLDPVEVAIKYKDDDSVYPFGTSSPLPAVTCVARLESLSAATGQEGDGSGLVLIWFQANFAFPIDEEILRQVSELDWNRYAGSYYYQVGVLLGDGWRVRLS